MLYQSYDEALYFLNYSHSYEKKYSLLREDFLIIVRIFSHRSENSLMFVLPYKFSISLSHIAELASLGILQSPRGLIEILPTLGPSGKQERLNC